MSKKSKVLCPILCLFFSLSYAGAPDINFNNPEDVDKTIEQLKTQLESKGMQEIKEDVGGQGAMISDWGKYGQEVQDIRAIQEQQNAIRKQIQELEQKKARLLPEPKL